LGLLLILRMIMQRRSRQHDGTDGLAINAQILSRGTNDAIEFDMDFA
jgi:hypothetical protein